MAGVARTLPLLNRTAGVTPAIQFAVLIDADSSSPAYPIIESRYESLHDAGVSLLPIGLSWSAMEPNLGQIDLTNFLLQLEKGVALGLQPFLNIAAIDTNHLAVPADLTDPQNPQAFRSDLNFASQEVISRYLALVDQLILSALDARIFYLGVGNEIDAFLGDPINAVQTGHFITFLKAVQSHLQTKYSAQLAVGATLGSGGIFVLNDLPIAASNAWIVDLMTTADLVPLTYYPLHDNFTVQDPSVVFADIENIIKVYMRYPGLHILFQEFGYPSGYLTNSSDGSSQQLQSTFFTNFFAAIKNHPETIVGASVFKLDEWTSQYCDALGQYYGSADPLFLEYLCTLGLLSEDGTPKLAYSNLFSMIKQFPRTQISSTSPMLPPVLFIPFLIFVLIGFIL